VLEGKKTNATRKHDCPDVRTATELLRPIVAFLRASGADESTVRRALKISWDRSATKQSKVSVGTLARSSSYGEIVAVWKRDPRFLDRFGHAKALGIKGKLGFAELVADIDPGLDPQLAAENLQRFGNISVSKAGKLRLLTDFFHIRSDLSLAYEPSARFMNDVAASIGNSLSIKRKPRSAGPFWRMAEAHNLPAGLTKKYERFARCRSLQFLQEVDDWLAQHQAKPGSRKKQVRAGIGVIAILPKERNDS
jgi:hypothetical protein